jgi:tetratricopeptide (TPR) repeat protein
MTPFLRSLTHRDCFRSEVLDRHRINLIAVDANLLDLACILATRNRQSQIVNETSSLTSKWLNLGCSLRETLLLEHEDDPRTVVKRFWVTLFGPDEIAAADWIPLLSKVALKNFQERSSELESTSRSAKNSFVRFGVAPVVLVDMVLSQMEIRMDGNDSTGYRIITQGPGSSQGPSSMTFYVVKEDGQYKILDAEFSPKSLGEEVLARVERGDLAGSRRILDWVREDQPATGGDDPLGGAVFSHVWSKASPTNRDSIRYAAAAMIASGNQVPPSANSILQEAVAKATPPDSRKYFIVALVRALTSQKKYADAVSMVQQLVKAYPESRTAFFMMNGAFLSLERWSDLEKAIADRLQIIPDDTDALRMRRELLARQNRLEESMAIARGLVETGKARPGDYNEIAWGALIRGEVTAEDIKAAQRASTLTQNAEANVLHTLAAVYAEVGQTTEARETLLQMMEVGGLEEPNGYAWYVFGRIAEQFGIFDAAAADYRKVEKPEENLVTSTYALAKRRLQIIEGQTSQ